jgi:Ca2+-binding EF-hand superfamily protein
MKVAVLIPATFAVALAYAMNAFAEMPDIRSNMRDLQGCADGTSVKSFSQVDIDRDGRINFREMKTADKADLPLFEVIDEDRDGFVSKAELTEHTKDRTGGCVN